MIRPHSPLPIVRKTAVIGPAIVIPYLCPSAVDGQ